VEDMIRRHLLTIILIIIVGESGAQQLADTTLHSITVTGFEEDKIDNQAASISYLSPKESEMFSPVDPVMAWNSLAGVNLEQRAISSYRVSIRGSALRSPFGVRNVKIYWNDLIFTEANGTTALNLLSNLQMREVEVIRGPSGSMYGAGFGGVIRLSNFPKNSNKFNLNLTTGSFGLFDGSISHQFKKEKWTSSYSASFQSTDGYRAHNAQEKLVLQWSNRYQFNEDHQVSLHTLYSDLNYEIPGGLTREQYDNDPTQARAGSAEQNASIDQKTLLLGVNYKSYLSSRLNQNTNVAFTYTDFKNPFILDYKEDVNKELSIRQQWSYTTELPVEIKWNAGWEWQYADNRARNFGNVNGELDTIRFSDNLIIDRKIYFLQSQISLGDWKVTLGASGNLLDYRVDREINAFAEPFTFERSFDNEIIPRIAAQYRWNNKQMTYASFSEGFSSPTLDEIRTNEGSINTFLEAERGTNYEIGHKLYSERFQADIAIFHTQLSDAITTRTDPNGVVLFQNSGETSQNGLEASVNALLHTNSKGLISKLKSRVAYQYYDFRFDNYSKRGEDFSGNRLTGVPEHTLFKSLLVEFKNRLTAHLQYRHMSAVPLTDANTVFADDYHLFNCKLQYELKFGNTSSQIYIGAENLADKKYSLGNDLNAFGGRYFQPAPGRNFYVGFSLRF